MTDYRPNHTYEKDSGRSERIATLSARRNLIELSAGIIDDTVAFMERHKTPDTVPAQVAQTAVDASLRTEAAVESITPHANTEQDTSIMHALLEEVEPAPDMSSQPIPSNPAENPIIDELTRLELDPIAQARRLVELANQEAGADLARLNPAPHLSAKRPVDVAQ